LFKTTDILLKASVEEAPSGDVIGMCKKHVHQRV